jgi:uncharacterized protein
VAAAPSQWRLKFNREMRRWHWISAAVCLAAVLLFSVTGVTLNHAASIGAAPSVTELESELPPELLHELAAAGAHESVSLPDGVRRWLQEESGITVGGAPVEWSEDEAYVSLPAPGADAWLALDRETGRLEYEHTDRGWIAFFNDVHKGRNTGPWWNAFIDVVAIACVVFSLTGLVLLQTAARQRRSTWPLVGSGIAVLALLLFLAH